jgi:REP element-mobilizing transposase RayT
MARPLRIKAAGIVYHVTSRGNGGRDIFLDRCDRFRFLALVDRACWIRKVECLAYCLVANHYHLLLRPEGPDISTAIHDLNGVYAQWWNRRHGTVGHLWQGRFFSRVVQHDRYFRAVVRYILRNPVKDGFCRTPGAWAWSSFRASAGLSHPPPFLATDGLWRLLGEATANAGQRHVRQLVETEDESGLDLPEIDESTWLVGDEAFGRALRPAEPRTLSSEIPVRQRFGGRPSLVALFDGASTLSERNRRILEARQAHGYSLREIAMFLGRHYATVSRAVTSGSGLALRGSPQMLQRKT